jgi:hypothetical protein
MTRIEPAAVCLFVISITASAAALADFPHTMSAQLLEGCIVYEGDGSRFPTGGYPCMDRYQRLAEDTAANSNNFTVYSKV